jgi:glutamate/tyrosine decarboxylase-like PLP-dependent enzyme
MRIDQIRNDFAAVEAAIADGPLVANVTAADVRAHLCSRFDFSKPMPLDEVIADVEQMLRNWQTQVTHPRYFGLFNPSVTVASVVADTLVALYNPQLANWRTSPAANEMERHVLGWLAGKFGLPSDSIATFTSGGSEANLSAVVVALTWAFPEYGEHGLRHLAGDPTIYLTEETHHGFNKIAHMAGLGRRNLRIVSTDSNLKMNVESLMQRVAEDRAQGLIPFMVIGTAGTTAAGVIDPLEEIAKYCGQEKLWFHADAAYGGAAAISPKLKPFLAGIEAADSITCDAHKWLSVPMGCGMFFCRHRESVAQAFRSDVTYMPARPENEDAAATFNPLTHSAQWSRRFIGLKLFMTLAEQGEAGYAEMLDHQAHMGDVLRDSLSSAGWKIINSTPLPVVCFTRDDLDTAWLIAELRDRQIAWMSDAQVGGIAVIRACITSFKTTRRDIEQVVSQMNGIAASAPKLGGKAQTADQAMSEEANELSVAKSGVNR